MACLTSLLQRLAHLIEFVGGDPPRGECVVALPTLVGVVDAADGVRRVHPIGTSDVADVGTVREIDGLSIVAEKAAGAEEKDSPQRNCGENFPHLELPP